MKKTKLFLSTMMAVCSAVFMATTVACTDGKTGEEQAAEYSVTVSSSSSIPDGISARLISTSGTIVSERPIVEGKTQFDVEDGEYIVTLIGVPLSLDFSAQVVKASAKSATITLSAPKTDSVSGQSLMTYTVFAYSTSGVAVSLPYSYAQLCNDSNCYLPADKTQSSAIKFSVPTGDYRLKVLEDVYAKGEKSCTVSTDERTTVITLSEKTSE